MKSAKKKENSVLSSRILTISIVLTVIIFLFSTAGCNRFNDNSGSATTTSATTTKTDDSRKSLINPSGSTIEDRIAVPDGFERNPVPKDSYADYLRKILLKPDGSSIKKYDGSVLSKEVHAAVMDIDTGSRDLQQCADAVIRLWAEYLYGRGLYEKIHFNFTNGFPAEYIKWMNGSRIIVQGNDSWWVDNAAAASNDYASFREYLDIVFMYAGTLSLSQEMVKVPVSDMKAGDIFLKGETPGHCVLVIDTAVSHMSGEKIFLLAQSFMPAQDIHILVNPQNAGISPWYSLDHLMKENILITPEWRFDSSQLMRFQDALQ